MKQTDISTYISSVQNARRLKLDRDLVFLDLEATGVDVARDRIVQIALARMTPDGIRTTMESLVNPEMRIPKESTEIHKISDEMVKDAPKLRDLAPKILEFIDGADLGGFGVTRFDIPMLIAEFKRVGHVFSVNGRRVVDALIIFHKMESRTLSAAMQFYCGKTMEGAHNALADTTAALDVFLAQVERYNGADGKPELPADLDGLHAFCSAGNPGNVDTKGKFVWRHGAATFNFGKHQTRTLEDVARTDRSYIEWLMNADMTTPEVAEICRLALQGVFPKRQ